MKTLNEQIYEYLLLENRPMTVPEVHLSENFKDVPANAIGKGLLAICAEGLINYYMKDGKIYFSTDHSVGRGPIGSQSNMNNLAGALSAFFGGAETDMISLLGNMTKAFPEVGDSSVDTKLDEIAFSVKAMGDDCEISFPQNADVEAEPDETHTFVATLTGMPISSMTISINEIGEGLSEKTIKMTLRSLCERQIKKIYKCLDAPEEYCKAGITAYCLLAVPNSFAYVARPDSMCVLRVDWNFEGKLPSKKAVCNFFERWLNSYKYFGNIQYREFPPIDREELLKEYATADIEHRIAEEYENSLEEVNRQINLIKSAVDSEEGTNKPTTMSYRTRKALGEAAEAMDDLIAQATNVITHYKSSKASKEFLDQVYYLSQAVIDVASDICATVTVNESSIPYYSATDIAVGAASTTEQTVQVFPTRYLEFLELITTERLHGQTIDVKTQENIKAFHKEMKARFDQANKPPVYYSDFIFEGKLLAAYLGHDEDVLVPDFVTAIGSYAFKNAKELKNITLGENVATIGFCPFEGCGALRTVKVLGDIRDVQGPLMGFGAASKVIIQSYENSYIEQYCKESNISFEKIREDNQDCIIELEKNAYDLYQGFALPKIVGYKTTQEFSASEQKRLAADGETSHIQYGMVPADQKLADYKDVKFSFTVVQDSIDVPAGGLQIAEEIERRFKQPTVHDVYRAVKADKNNVLVRYDMTREGDDDGNRWATYVVVIAREKKLLVAQIFINGNYSHRQQIYAIDKWASKILVEKTYKDKQKKLEEEKAREEAKRKKAAIELANKQRLEEEAKRYSVAVEEAKQKQDEEIATLKERLKAEYDEGLALAQKTFDEAMQKAETLKRKLKAEQKSLSDQLQMLGFFNFGAKSRIKARLAAIETELTDNERTPAILRAMLNKQEKELRDEHDRKLALGTDAIESRHIVPTHNPAPYQVNNEDIKQIIYSSMQRGKLYTIEEMIDTFPLPADISNQKVTALTRQLLLAEKIEKVVQNRLSYFRKP